MIVSVIMTQVSVLPKSNRHQDEDIHKKGGIHKQVSVTLNVNLTLIQNPLLLTTPSLGHHTDHHNYPSHTSGATGQQVLS